MVKTKKKTPNIVRSSGTSHNLLARIYIGAATLENIVVFSTEVEDMHIHHLTIPFLGMCTTEIDEVLYSGIMHNGLIVKTTQLSVNMKMDG